MRTRAANHQRFTTAREEAAKKKAAQEKRREKRKERRKANREGAGKQDKHDDLLKKINNLSLRLEEKDEEIERHRQESGWNNQKKGKGKKGGAGKKQRVRFAKES